VCPNSGFSDLGFDESQSATLYQGTALAVPKASK